MTQPSNFSWFVEGRLAGMGYPEEMNIPFLAQKGVKTLVNLHDQGRHYYSEVTTANGIRVHTTVNVPDFKPPSLKQIRDFLEVLDAAKEDGAIGVHCLEGCGRTGTMLACYLVGREGYGADEAVHETKRRRPGSFQIPEQQAAVYQFEQSLKEGRD